MTYHSNTSDWHRPDSVYDLVCYLTANSKGWILDRVAKEIIRASQRHGKRVYLERVDVIHLPVIRSDRNFFMNFDIAVWCLKKYPELSRASNYVFFTHPDPIRTSDPVILRNTFNSVTKVFTMNSGDARRLEELGVEPERIATVVGGYDPEMFAPQADRRGDKMGVIGAYYERKNHARLLEFARGCPQLDFLVIAPNPDTLVNKGLDWRNWSRFGEFVGLPNVEFVEADHPDYPALYADIEVFLSLASMEGGPIPLLECLGSGIPAVVTPTGFAPDVIEEGKNGVIIPHDASDEMICEAIVSCRNMIPERISESVRGLSWQDLGERIAGLQQLSVDGDQTVKFAQDKFGQFMLETGWHPVEPNGVWSSDMLATVRVPLKQRRDGIFRLIFTIWALNRPDGEPHPVSVQLNDREAVSLEDLGVAPKEVTLELRADEVSPHGELVEFRCEHLLCSSMAGAASKKALGIRLGRLQIEYVVGAPEA